jgi:ubiquinone/menaquinone biosynthesis C-methylase UbiE
MDIQKFKDNGYVVLNPDKVFSKKYINELANDFDSSMFDYNDGKVDPITNNSREDPRFDYSHKIGDIKLFGCATRHMYFRGKGSVDISLDDNFLYGKRGVLMELDFSTKIKKLVENKKTLDLVRKFLGVNDVSFHNGSLASVFPGCQGEAKKYHIDTPGFCDSNFNFFISNKHLINIVIYLSDVSEKNAPLRVIPGSHKKLGIINEYFSKACGLSSSKNNIPQANGGLYSELIPRELNKEIKLTGKRGTVILMNSNLVHGSTENDTISNTRKAIFLNYSARNDTFFRKNYYLNDPKKCTDFYKSFKDKDIVKRTFQNNIASFKLTKFKRWVKPKISSFRRNWRLPLAPFYRPIKSIINNVSLEKKQYLNIGAGPLWRHREMASLDYSSESEISHDLNKKNKLPFSDNRFLGIYSSHCLEHLIQSQVKWYFVDFKRILKDGGVLRITLPNIELYFDAYDNKDLAFFNWIRNKGAYSNDSWLRLLVRSFAEPVVDKFSDDQIYDLYKNLSRNDFLNFFSAEVDVIKDERFLHPNAHKSWWSPKKLSKALMEAGFSQVNIQERRSSSCILFSRDTRLNNNGPHMSLYIEAIK